MIVHKLQYTQHTYFFDHFQAEYFAILVQIFVFRLLFFSLHLVIIK